MKKEFVTFNFGSLLIHENVTENIDFWSVDKAVEKAKSIAQTHSRIPFRFRFSTVEETTKDGHRSAETTGKSPWYYLGGNVLTLADVKGRNEASDKILIDNMETNGWAKVIETAGVTQPLNESDIVLQVRF